jgi:hypothetical protein
MFEVPGDVAGILREAIGQKVAGCLDVEGLLNFGKGCHKQVKEDQHRDQDGRCAIYWAWLGLAFTCIASKLTRYAFEHEF